MMIGLRFTTMLLPLTIGQSSSGKPVTLDLSRMPHLFLSYADGAGADAFFRRLWDGLHEAGSAPFLAVALSSGEAAARLPAHLRSWLFSALIAGEEGRMETFFRHLLRERSRRLRARQAAPPLLVVIDDLFDVLRSPKKSVQSAVLQLLLGGPAAGIHLIAASGGPFRQLLRQVCHYDPRLQHKFSSIEAGAYPASAFGAELVLTGEELVYFKGASDGDYQRLYPLCERRLLPALG